MEGQEREKENMAETPRSAIEDLGQSAHSQGREKFCLGPSWKGCAFLQSTVWYLLCGSQILPFQAIIGKTLISITHESNMIQIYFVI